MTNAKPDQGRELFAFMLNPAASLHAAWRSHLPAWGMPEPLCDRLWEHRHQEGDLSRFLTERFQLCLTGWADIQTPYRWLIVRESQELEMALMRLGALFLHPAAMRILDGNQLRRLKQEFGEGNFHFLRHQAEHFVAAVSLPPELEQQSISKRQALLLGLAALLNHLPPSSDLLTRLCFKLPPFADEPQPPEGFALMRHLVEKIPLPPSERLEAVFAHRGNHAKQN